MFTECVRYPTHVERILVAGPLTSILSVKVDYDLSDDPDKTPSLPLRGEGLLTLPELQEVH